MAEQAIELEEPALERQREAEHRVKNTLQLISSIVLLQGRRAADDAAKQALKAVQQRVAAVSVAHRHVAWSDGGERVELAGLVREIVGDLAGSAGREGVAIDLDLEPVYIPGRQGASFALLLSETVGNCLRHAFPEGRPGRVQVSLRRRGEAFELSVADDGVGAPDGGSATGFGLTVAQLMAQQLRGKLAMTPAQPGLKLSVSIPMDAQAPRT
jgi:two-component sensor histidine kinase